jgi:hypothetical protein
VTPTLSTADPPVRPSNGSLNVGFLTVLHEANGYLGGYLVTNTWGRPLEFRLSSAVQPNRVQQILYAGTLEPYICADLIGKTLLDKTGVPAQLIVTDRELVLDLRLKVEAPVAWLVAADEPRAAVRTPRGGLVFHPRFEGDAATVREMLDHIDSTFDLAEPFQRIREAIGEARKLGVASRN